jgi:hypothetical protein
LITSEKSADTLSRRTSFIHSRGIIFSFAFLIFARTNAMYWPCAASSPSELDSMLLPRRVPA